jgi:hypothetical protein
VLPEQFSCRSRLLLCNLLLQFALGCSCRPVLLLLHHATQQPHSCSAVQLLAGRT